jgi:hypothetical protein
MDFITKHSKYIQVALITVIVGAIIVHMAYPDLLKEQFANLADAGKVYVKEDDEGKMTKVDFSAPKEQSALPLDLLPKQEFAEEINTPSMPGNYLDVGSVIGMNTSTRRNSNTTLRSSPPIPIVPTGPWNELIYSTEPDKYRGTLDSC